MHEYSWLALVTVEDAAQFRVKVLNVGSKVVYLADALLQKSQKKMSALLYFPIDERYPREVEEFRLAPCRVMHLHAAHVNLEWQNIHTEQFEPRLRRYVRSQLNTRIAEHDVQPDAADGRRSTRHDPVQRARRYHGGQGSDGLHQQGTTKQ